jgi:exosortase family protein XrtM
MAITPLRFGIRFILGFAILTGVFEASRGSALETFLVEDLILAPTVHLIDVITPNEHVELIGRTLASAGSHLRITRGCEGTEMFLLLLSAILAFPTTLRHRIRGLLWGAGLVYALTIIRLMALHYILRYSPSAWEALHGLVMPLAPIVVIGLYFLRWSGHSPHLTVGEPHAQPA